MSDMSGMPESGDTQDTQAGASCSVDSCSVEEPKKVKNDSDCCKPDDACKTEGTPCETGA